MGFWNPYDSSPSRRHRSSHNSSQRGPSSWQSNFFSTSRGRSHGSSRARPRSGFVARVRAFLAKIYDYMRRHPAKVFFLVIMPLITGGALAKLLATVGLRLPPSLAQFVGGGRGVRESERFFARGGARDFAGG